MSAELSILLCQGDAEARLLADADAVLPALFPERDVRLRRVWAPHPDWLDLKSRVVPLALYGGGLPADASSEDKSSATSTQDVRDLLEEPHRLVIFSVLGAVMLTARGEAAGAWLSYRGLEQEPRESGSSAAAAEREALFGPAPMSPRAAVQALAPVIERLQMSGMVVAVCNAFRHVREPLRHRASGDGDLRQRIRALNLEVARLSQSTGCFVLDLDRPLAQQGGAALDADCFGGDGRAAEIALDEFAALLLDALPDELLSPEIA